MISWSRFAITAATHGLAVAGGWLLLSQFNRPTAASPPPTASSKTTQRTSTPERSVDEILAEFTGPNKKVTPEAKKFLDFRDSAKAAIRDLTPPGDFAAAVDEEMKAWSASGGPRSAKLIALMYHWMATDPAALFKWAGKDPDRLKAMQGNATFAIEMLLADRGGTALLPAIGSAGTLNNYIMNLTATQIAVTGDLSAYRSMKEYVERMDPQVWQYIRQMTTGQWTAEKKAELLQIAIEENTPAVLATLPSRFPDSAAWVASLATDTSLPEDFRKAFLANRDLRQFLSSDPLTPLEDRLTYLDIPDQKIAMDRLIRGDVMRLMSAPQDLSFSFRRGEMTAEEVYQAIAAGTPELAAASPQELRSLVFQNLAEDDPAKAMALLKDLPESEQHQTMLKAARTFFNDVEPDHFLAALQQVPSDTPDLWEQRLDAWNIRSFTNSNRLNEDFIAWVRELPPGVDREMGLYSLARAVQLNDLKLAAQLRSEVTDPQLQQRIAEHK